MSHFPTRRSILLSAAALPQLSACAAIGDQANAAASAQQQLSAIENAPGGRLGLFACAAADDQRLEYRADERIPVGSTFKLLLVSAILKMSTQPGLMQQVLSYRHSDLVEYLPVTEQYVGVGMSVADLCAAVMTGAVERVLLKIMTVVALMAGLFCPSRGGPAPVRK